jgi:putative chitinase
MKFDRKRYFDSVRPKPFGGTLSQGQVDGQEWLLGYFEMSEVSDLRWFAYMLATTYHETAQTMQPIEEYGKGQGHDYGTSDPETGQTYYGRGYVQLTWRDNYRRASDELNLSDAEDLEWHAELALDKAIAAAVLVYGMSDGWFTGKRLEQYFSETVDDPINARAIINNDVAKMGKTIASYHQAFLEALDEALVTAPEPAEEPTIDILH